jgi:hypothetical protein
MTTITPTITISLKRAMDIQFQDVIRLKPKGDWQFVYDAAQDGDYPPDTDEARVVTNELDGRYVLLRLATDPDMSIDDRYDHTLHAWLANSPGGLPRGDWADGRPKHFGLPSEPTSEYVVLRQYDLVEVQTLVQTEAQPEDRSERTVYRVTAADIDEMLGDIAEEGDPPGRIATDEELTRIADALDHSSIPGAIVEVLFSVCGTADEDPEQP